MDFTEEIKPIEYSKEAETFPKFPTPDIPTVIPQIQDLPNISSLSCGVGAKSLHIDKQGLWLGSNSFDEAPFKVGIDGSFSESSSVASTDMVTILEAVYPVGSIYTSVVSTNPLSLFGFGTWVAFGAGKVLIGLDSGDASFDSVEETGGVKEVTLSAAQSGLVGHNHTQDAHTHIQNAHDHGFINTTNMGGGAYAGPNSSGSSTRNWVEDETAVNQNATAVNQAVTSAAASTAHTNLMPYIVVYFFKRTA